MSCSVQITHADQMPGTDKVYFKITSGSETVKSKSTKAPYQFNETFTFQNPGNIQVDLYDDNLLKDTLMGSGIINGTQSYSGPISISGPKTQCRMHVVVTPSGYGQMPQTGYSQPVYGQPCHPHHSGSAYPATTSYGQTSYTTTSHGQPMMMPTQHSHEGYHHADHVPTFVQPQTAYTTVTQPSYTSYGHTSGMPTTTMPMSTGMAHTSYSTMPPTTGYSTMPPTTGYSTMPPTTGYSTMPPTTGYSTMPHGTTSGTYTTQTTHTGYAPTYMPPSSAPHY